MKKGKILAIGMATAMVLMALAIVWPSTASADDDPPEIALGLYEEDSYNGSFIGTISVNNGIIDDPIEDDGDGDESIWTISGATITTTVDVFNGGTLYMDGCIFSGITTSVVFNQGSAGWVKNTVITGTGYYSGYAISILPYTTDILIEGCTLYNAGYGVWVDAHNDGIQVLNNDIQHCDRGVMIRYGYNGEVNVVNGNYFYDCTYDLKLYGIASPGAIVEFGHNTCEGNNAYSVYAYISSVWLHDNTFYDCGYPSMDAWTHCSAVAGVGCTSVNDWYNMERSVIEHNTFDQGPSGGAAIEGYFCDFMVSHNTITLQGTGWDLGIWIRGGTGFEPALCGVPFDGMHKGWSVEYTEFYGAGSSEGILFSGGGYGASGLWVDDCQFYDCAKAVRLWTNYGQYMSMTDWYYEPDTTVLLSMEGTGYNFWDTNSDGSWNDPIEVDGEPFEDLNGNGIYDKGEPYTDLYPNDEYDGGYYNPNNPKNYKQQALDELNAIYPTGDKKIDKKLEKAINHINKSLNPDLWEDDNHLDEKHGKKVFDEEKKAVKELKKLIDKKDTPQDVKDVCQEVIDKLVEADDILAHTVYDEASAYAGDPKVDKELEKCDKEFEKAQKELDHTKKDGAPDPHYDKAIDHFKKAWEHAQKALKHAKGGE